MNSFEEMNVDNAESCIIDHVFMLTKISERSYIALKMSAVILIYCIHFEKISANLRFTSVNLTIISILSVCYFQSVFRAAGYSIIEQYGNSSMIC